MGGRRGGRGDAQVKESGLKVCGGVCGGVYLILQGLELVQAAAGVLRPNAGHKTQKKHPIGGRGGILPETTQIVTTQYLFCINHAWERKVLYQKSASSN